MAEKHVHKVYSSFPPWGKSVEFPSTGGGGGNYVYYSGTENDFQELIMLASVIKYESAEGVQFLTSGWFRGDIDEGEVIGAGFDLSLKVSSLFTGELTTIGDSFAEIGAGKWPQITEEEFYKITPKFAILHHGGGEHVTIHEYEEGMTWGEWVNSDYNTINALISDSGQVQILDPNNDWNATLGSKTDGWLYDSNIIKSEQYDAYY